MNAQETGRMLDPLGHAGARGDELSQARPETHGARANKLRLNAKQWQTLLSLASKNGNFARDLCAPERGRLTSNGLVAMDHRGRACLTVFGLQRLHQGR